MKKCPPILVSGFMSAFPVVSYLNRKKGIVASIVLTAPILALLFSKITVAVRVRK